MVCSVYEKKGGVAFWRANDERLKGRMMCEEELVPLQFEGDNGSNRCGEERSCCGSSAKVVAVPEEDVPLWGKCATCGSGASVAPCG